MLRKIRIVAAVLFFLLITLLFLDFTGTLHAWFGWMSKIQFLPALLAVNVGVVLALVALTLLFGRVYCSVICPLGVMQDIVSWFAGRRKKHRYRFSYSPALTWLRWTMLAVFVAAMLAGVGWLIAPYSAYGRIASNLFAPIYAWGNNGLAWIAERMDSYAFYSVEVWMKSLGMFLIAVVTFAGLSFLAWRSGRTWWERCWACCPAARCSGRVSTCRNATAANSAPAAARRRASTRRTIRSITAVAWLAWIVSNPVIRGPSPIPCGGRNGRRLPLPGNLGPTLRGAGSSACWGSSLTPPCVRRRRRSMADWP